MPPRRHSRISVANQSKRFAEQRRRRLIIGCVAGPIALISIIFVLSRLSSLPFVTIENIQVYGADSDIVPSVDLAALGALKGSYLGIFSRSDALLYPRSAVAAAVKASSPRILSVSVDRAGLDGLVVSVSEKSPAAVICPELPDFDANGSLVIDNGECYAADSSGLIFEKMPASAQAPQGERYYVPDLSGMPVIGSYATSTAEFLSLQSFLEGARSAGITTEGLLFKDGGEYELYADNPPAALSAATSTPVAVVYMNDAAGLDTELSDLTAFWSHMASTDGARPSFESVDLRYGSNVFYRIAQ